MRRPAAALVAVLAWLSWGGSAAAHPHVLVDVHALAEFKNGRIVSLFMGWKFDPVYSATLFQDFDKDKNGKLDPAEIREIEAQAFRETKDQGYFTYAKLDGKPVAWKDVSDFTVMGVKDSLLYAFRLHFPEPIDPRKGVLGVVTYEESFYIDMDFPNDKAVTLTGEGSQGCRATIAPDPASAIYGGIVIPKRAVVSCE
ncbi:ABC transporter [Paramagnetospirillum marisnigri]|uniref:ABC transporter n=1 Tax=Paramagnetospirillum marisnigri TaxID=1285242 RepID=A0A178MY16_9PROT|nr:DUF1007 family protein [Paramagnetospirillum marisnigri]OAN56005.1 ABC transporter [Paramagnetospirillum marisnigri]